MRKLFKLISRLIVIIIIAGIVSTIYVISKMKDETDNTPIELYTEDVNKDALLGSAIGDALDLSAKSSVDILFSEEELNKLIYAIVKENVNSDYNPGKTDASDKEKYIYSINLFKDKRLALKSAYVNIEDSKISVTACLDLAVFPSTITLGVEFKEDNDSFKVQVHEFMLGKFDATKGIAKKIVDIAIEKLNLAKYTKIKIGELNLSMDVKTLTVSVPKDDIANAISKLVSSGETTDATLQSVVDMLTAKENDLVNIGVVGDKFGLQFDLSKMKVNEAATKLDESVKTFDEDLFILNKTQSFAISNLGDLDPKIVLTDKDITSILYNQSNGYNGFEIAINLPNSDKTFNMSVLGITIKFLKVDAKYQMRLSVIVDLNGLKTVIELTGEIKDNNTSAIKIKLDDNLTIGKDVTKNEKEYIKASSKLITSVLSERISDLGIMTYDSATNSFVINASSFTELFAVTGSGTLPLSVNKLNIVDGNLEAYVSITSSTVLSTFTEVTNAISDVLENTDFSSVFTDTTDENVNAAKEVLENTSQALQEGNLSEEDINDLVDAINMLSSENQESLLNEIQANLPDASNLEELYDSLFGK